MIQTTRTIAITVLIAGAIAWMVADTYEMAGLATASMAAVALSIATTVWCRICE